MRSGTQQGSGIPGTTPTALTMLWMVAWFDGFKDCKKAKQLKPYLKQHQRLILLKLAGVHLGWRK